MEQAHCLCLLLASHLLLVKEGLQVVNLALAAHKERHTLMDLFRADVQYSGYASGAAASSLL